MGLTVPIMGPMMRIMQQVIRINGIKERAEKLGLTMSNLFQEARPKVPESSGSRWLKKPPRSRYDECCNRLEAVLQRREKALRKHLDKVTPANGTTRVPA